MGGTLWPKFAGDANAIKNSRVIIDNSPPSYGIGALQIGPDLKIYASVSESSYVGVINNPNVRGLGCNFVKEGVYLDGGICQSGLPTFINSYFYMSVSGYSNSPICEGEAIHLTCDTIESGSYKWTGPNGFESDEQNPVIYNSTPDMSGKYVITVSYNVERIASDTVQVTIIPKLAEEVFIWLENDDEFVPKDDINIKLMASFVGLVDPGEQISFESTISYYRTSLYITSVDLGNILSNETNGELNLMTLKTNNVQVINDTILLAEIHGMILLSDSTNNKLSVEKFSGGGFNGECTYIRMDSSVFNVNACGFDLIHIKSFLPTQMSFNPNPALNNATFEITSEEQGYFTLSIYSTEGIAQYTTNWQNHSKNKLKEINMDLSNFPSGIYQVVLKSPWNIISKRLSIIK